MYSRILCLFRQSSYLIHRIQYKIPSVSTTYNSQADSLVLHLLHARWAFHRKRESCSRLNFTRFFAPVPEQLFAAISHNTRRERIVGRIRRCFWNRVFHFRVLSRACVSNQSRKLGECDLRNPMMTFDDILTLRNEYNVRKRYNKKIQVFDVLYVGYTYC